MKEISKISLSKKGKKYLVIAICILIIGLILSITYRPYIYRNDINDFKFADTLGSLISVICFCFIVWGFKDFSSSEKNKHIILATIGYSIIYEPLGLLGIHGTFDWFDMIAAILSGIIAFIIKEIIERKYTTINEMKK